MGAGRHFRAEERRPAQSRGERLLVCIGARSYVRRAGGQGNSRAVLAGCVTEWRSDAGAPDRRDRKQGRTRTARLAGAPRSSAAANLAPRADGAHSRSIGASSTPQMMSGKGRRVGINRFETAAQPASGTCPGNGGGIAYAIIRPPPTSSFRIHSFTSPFRHILNKNLISAT